MVVLCCTVLYFFEKSQFMQLDISVDDVYFCKQQGSRVGLTLSIMYLNMQYIKYNMFYGSQSGFFFLFVHFFEQEKIHVSAKEL